MNLTQAVTFATAATLISAAAVADVRLPTLISDHMVLQCDVPVRIWGWADPQETVTVELLDESQTATADAEGKWEVMLGPLAARNEPTTLVARGKNRVEIDDVLIGEVWVVAGQSNIWWPVSRTTDASGEIQAADHPRLRLFTVPVAVADKPLNDIDPAPPKVQGPPPEPKRLGEWFASNPDDVGDFSGVAYYFGRDLMQRRDVPVGIISAGVGGTIVSSWTSRPALAATEVGPPILTYWDYYVAELYPQKLAEYRQQLEHWKSDNPGVDPVSADGTVAEGAPTEPLDGTRYVNRPAALYNGMLAPITEITVRGALWYQGESNAVKPVEYRELLAAMVKDWREAWGDDDLPFLIVQLPNLDTSNYTSLGGPMDWPQLREAQAQVADELDAVGLIVTIDIGQADDAHPGNKQEVSQRAQPVADAIAYGESGEFTGPRFESLEIDGDKARVSFDHTTGGLTADGGKVLGFEIAGADRLYHPAVARIDGDQVVLSSPQVPEPEAVRYAWLDNPEATLRNGEGFPAAPFRTDDREAAPAPQGLDADFSRTGVGFWAQTGSPEGWTASDPSRAYTAAMGFLVLPTGDTVTGEPVEKPRDAQQFVLHAQLGGDAGATARVVLEALEEPGASSAARQLAVIERVGVGNYEREAVTSEPFEIPDDLSGGSLRVRLEADGQGTGYFDAVRLEPAEP